jgi:DNA-binding Lrp family transcriptional regulator
MKAYVLINCNLGAEKRICDDLNESLAEVTLTRVYGAYDIVMTIHDKDEKTISNIVNNVVRKHRGVHQTLILHSSTPGLEVNGG